jgi:hypothetical protein
MTVERTHADHQTRYALDAGAGLSCVLTYTAAPDEPATWKILLPGPAHGRMDTARQPRRLSRWPLLTNKVNSPDAVTGSPNLCGSLRPLTAQTGAAR